MLTNFEDITQDLTPYEKSFAEWLAPNLAKHVGKQRAITNKMIREKIEALGKGKFSDSHIRKIVHYIRSENLVVGLIATSKGYFVAESEIEIKDYIESLEQRESAIRAIRIRMQQYYKHISIPKPTLVPVETVYNG